jgi:hypothetical protein
MKKPRLKITHISLSIEDWALLKTAAVVNGHSLSEEVRNGLATHIEKLHRDFDASPDLVAAAATPVDFNSAFYPDLAKAVRAL